LQWLDSRAVNAYKCAQYFERIKDKGLSGSAEKG